MPFPAYPPTVPHFLADCVQRFGERPLILLDERRIDYREADAESARLARGLLARGIGKGSRVAVLMPNGPDWVVAWLAAARIGAVVVPINTFYKPRELGWILQHSDVEVLLCWARLLGNDYLERLESVAPGLRRLATPDLVLTELPCLRQVYVWGECDRRWARSSSELLETADADPRFDADFLARCEAGVAPSDPMITIYSSGSTADPKGAVHSHGGVIRHSYNLNSYRDLTPEDRVFSPMPFFWVGGFVFSLLSCMHSGAMLICEQAFEPGATLALLERERASVVAGWPHYAKAMLDHPSYPQRDLSRVRSGNVYGMLPEHLRPRDPELRSNALGMTETCGPHTIARMDVDLPEKLRGSFGRAPEGVEHKIVDPDTQAVLPPGRSGEICVRGYNLMLGLYKREREDVFDRDGFYHTGDAGRFDEDGVLYFEARLGDLIKTAGANVTPREVEVLIDAFPEVQVSFVAGVADAVRGQNVAAAIVLRSGAQLTAEQCRERLRSELAAYKIPRHWFFVDKADLPFTESGKIDKRRLSLLLEQRIAAASASEPARESV